MAKTFAVCDYKMVNASMAVSKTFKIYAASVSSQGADITLYFFRINTSSNGDDLKKLRRCCILHCDSVEGVAGVVLAHQLRIVCGAISLSSPVCTSSSRMLSSWARRC